MRSALEIFEGQMTIEIRVPVLGESVTEATVGKWFKKTGDAVKVDEPLVELETDKVTVEVPAPASGVMGEIIVAQGATVAVGSLLAALKDGAGAAASPAAAAKTEAVAAPPAAAKPAPVAVQPEPATPPPMPPSPAARKALAEASVDAADIHGSGRRGQVLKGDVIAATAARAEAAQSRSNGSEAKPIGTPLQPIRHRWRQRQ
jgi:2-oxoglutarate dehydrogenase E2 component (dihydrolipoamide succinyltransferase)